MHQQRDGLQAREAKVKAKAKGEEMEDEEDTAEGSTAGITAEQILLHRAVRGPTRVEGQPTTAKAQEEQKQTQTSGEHNDSSSFCVGHHWLSAVCSVHRHRSEHLSCAPRSRF